MKIDLAKYKTKKELLSLFADDFEELYGCNYDALYDVLTEIDKPFTLEIVNIDKYEQKDILLNLLEDARTYNENLTITIE